MYCIHSNIFKNSIPILYWGSHRTYLDYFLKAGCNATFEKYTNFMFQLQALLRQKQYELNALEKREAALFYNAKARLKQKELSEQKSQQSTEQKSETKSTRTITDSTTTSGKDTLSGVKTPQSLHNHSPYLETSFSSDNNNLISTTTGNTEAVTASAKQVLDVRPKTNK